MPRRVFYSFHYDADGARVSQVRNMGVVEGSPIASDNEWETIKRGGDPAIKRWIDTQMQGTSCCVVLIGSATADRKWVNYEIDQAWKQQKGVVGVHIYELKNLQGEKARSGSNPLDYVLISPGRAVSSVAKTYDPPPVDSKEVYAYIKTNLASWIEEAIRIRTAFR
jgi:antiphage defense system Thoeris ThsB-like protein